MSLFVADPEECLRDGVCVDECPRYLICGAMPIGYARYG